MSLFKICSWWSYQCPDLLKNYDSTSLACGQFVENNVQRDVIIVFSHSGILSIFQGATKDAAKITTLLEIDLKEPILNAFTGNFISGSKTDQQNTIAILHPMKLVIYAIVTSEGLTEQGNESKLQLINETTFNKSTYSMCKGNFGGVKGKDFICIMFLDGSLKFFEQDRIAHECMLPGQRTIPSCFVYVPRTDCFVSLSPNWDLECFRYLNLSESFERNFSPIWSLNIGEYILDMTTHQISNTESLIVMLGENNLWCVSDTGKMKFIKKLDYTPIAFCTFVLGWYWEADARLMIAVASNNGTLLIYNNGSLVWCAELTADVIAIKRATLSKLSGAIVTLNECGKLTVGFLGSEPHVFQVPPLKLNKLDYEKSIQELHEMEKEIELNADNNSLPISNAMAEKEIDIIANVSFENLSETESCILCLNLTANSNMEQVQVIFSVNPAFIIQQNIFFLKEVAKNETYILKTAISVNNFYEIYDLDVYVLISFINKQSIARLIKHKIVLPHKHFITKAPAQKDSLYKVIVATRQTAPDLLELFPDHATAVNTQAIGLKSITSSNGCTIVLAKSSNRYRLQSNSLISLLYIMTVLTAIFEQSNVDNDTDNGNRNGNGKKPLTVKSIPAATTEFLLSCVEKHYNLTKQLNDIIMTLNTKSLQMRLFERCFLKQIQGKALSSLDGIEMLLRDTYREIMDCSNAIKETRMNLNRIQFQLTSTFKFIDKQMDFMDVPENVRKCFKLLSKPIVDWQKKCWEESAEPYLSYLYNMFQLKMNKHQLYENFNFQQDNFSIVRFKKHLKCILDSIFDSLSDATKGAEKLLINFQDTHDEELENSTENQSEWKSQTTVSYQI